MDDDEMMAYLLEQEEKERQQQIVLTAKRRALWTERKAEGKIMVFDQRQGRIVEERFEGMPQSPIGQVSCQLKVKLSSNRYWARRS